MFRLSWRAKLVFFTILVALLPIAISSINMINSTKDELKSSTNDELINTANQLAQEINNIYADKWLAPLLLMRKGVESEELGAEEKTSFLSAGIENIEDIVAISLLFEVNPGQYVSAIETQKKSFLELLKSHGLPPDSIFLKPEVEISDIRREQKTMGRTRFIDGIDTWLMTILLPVSINGAPPAILRASIDLTDLRDRIASQPFAKSGRILLIDSEGYQVFDRSHQNLSNLKVVEEASNLLRSGSRASGVTVYETAAQQRVVASYAFPANLQWAVIAEIEEGRAYQAVSRMINYLALWAALGAVIAFAGVLVFSRQISRPILRMSSAAEAISSGNFDVKVEYQAKDEIGSLANSLVNMGRSLKENFHRIEKQKLELEEYNRTLEEKVDQRTNELKEKNIALEETLVKLKQTQDQLVTNEKLASLGALTAGIAHEIKNPLNFVNNFARLSVDLVKELEEEMGKYQKLVSPADAENLNEILETVKANVGKIMEHGGRADRIVHGMLQHSRGDTGEFQPTDINQLVDEYVHLAYQGLRASDSNFNVKIETDYDPTVGKFNINPQAFSRAVLNIVNNGCYAAFSRKKTAPPDFMPTLRISTQRSGDRLIVTIRDNGTGIPAAVRQKIFEPFFTTKPTGEGTGLGLSLTHDILVKMHNGEVRVNSEEGQFTEFVIILPDKK